MPSIANPFAQNFCTVSGGAKREDGPTGGPGAREGGTAENGHFVKGAFVAPMLRHRARRYGIRDGRSGSVTVIQRFGGGLNLNVHYHTCGSEH